MKIKNILALGVLSILFIPILGGSVALDSGELDAYKNKTFEFKDFKGKSKQKRTSSNALMNIGRSLSVNKNKQAKVYNSRYKMQHFSPSEDLLGADVFSILKGANVNTIKDVRLFLRGFLEKTYDYDYKQSSVIASIITIYNGFNRSDIEYFKKKYNKQVIKNLDASKVGLDASYKNWAGKTQIVIPLNNSSQKMDIFESAPDEVIESLKKQEDKGVEDREFIVDMKKEQIRDEQKDLDKQEAQVAKKEAANPNDPSLQKDKQKIAAKKKDLESKKEQVKKEESSIKEDKKALDGDGKKDGEDAKKLEESAAENEKTKAKLSAAEEEIARNEKIEKNKFYYLMSLKYLTGKESNSLIAALDATTKKEIARSSLKTISGKDFELMSQGIVVLLKENPSATFSNLALLDKEKFELISKGVQKIFSSGILRVKDNKIYAIVSENEGYYLGVFDESLKLIAISDSEVNPQTTVSFNEGEIYASGPQENILVFNKETLALITEVLS